MVKDTETEYDVEYLNRCKRVKFFMSENGPSLSIHCGNRMQIPDPNSMQNPCKTEGH